MKFKRFITYAAAATLSIGAVLGNLPSAHAEYPKGTIRAIVPFTPGGTSDALARLYSTKLSAMLDRTVVVENRGGASGNIGISVLAKSKPDGLTIMFSSSAVTWNPALFTKLDFDPVKDILPVARLADSAQLINVNSTKFPTQSLREVIQYAKEHPGKVNVAASGVGLVEAYFSVKNGIDVEIIRYKSSADAVRALLTGECDIFMGSALNIVPLMSTGKIRPIAVTGNIRMSVLANVPTTIEAGFPDIQFSYLFGAFIPGGTPPEVVKELNAALNKITGDAAVAAEVAKLGWTPKTGSAEIFGTEYRAEIAEWKDVAKRAKIEPID
jgi:tripartite-type tricarboxylate transporter receptor subunit TctC